MKKLSILTLFLAACSNSPETGKIPVQSIEKRDTAAIRQDSLKAQAPFVCPMGAECGYSDKPGKCPSCGMEMKPNKKPTK